MFKIVRKEFQFGNQTVVLETGRIARQASGAVFVTMGGVSVLVAVVGAKSAKPGQDFFPLTVNYQEKTYAAGRIPGGYFKREGRPTEKETLTSRLIDRPIRPLFPEGFLNEVQVTATVVSTDKTSDPDIAAMIGTSAALAISGIPFNGPVGRRAALPTSMVNTVNPTYEQLAQSELDLVVAGTEKAVLMVESEAKELSEDEMLGAVLFGHDEMQVAIQAIKAFAAEVGNAPWDWTAPAKNETLKAALKAPLKPAFPMPTPFAKSRCVTASWTSSRSRPWPSLRPKGAMYRR
jgi:polyribonucleotide nucleotidyltransferase